MSASKLTPKQERFCLEYMEDLNGTQAAKRAGYSEHTANEQAARLLAKVSIQARIAELQAEFREKKEISIERVLAEYAKMGFSDITDVVTVEGEEASVRDFKDLPRHVKSSISKVKAKRRTIKNKEGEEIAVDHEIEIAMHDKKGALDALSRHLGIFNDSLTIKDDLNNKSDEELLKIINGRNE